MPDLSNAELVHLHLLPFSLKVTKKFTNYIQTVSLQFTF